jgi:hypothetical protein
MAGVRGKERRVSGLSNEKRAWVRLSRPQVLSASEVARGMAWEDIVVDESCWRVAAGLGNVGRCGVCTLD